MLIKANKVENRMKSDWILIILSIIVGIVLTLIVVFSGIELNRRYKEKDCMKNKIEVGEYVRTNKGNIGKIVEIRLGFNKDTQLYQDIYILDNGLWTVLDYRVKHSKQLTDLIEDKDIVEIELSEEFVEKKDKKKLIQIGDIYTKEALQKDIDNGIITRILKILPYNQYMANCYKVGGKEECM